MTTTIYVDGGCHNNGTMDAKMYGSFLVEGDVRIRDAFDLGNGTNNQAEYLTLIRALECAKTIDPRPDLVIYQDSQLVVNQVNGEWKVKDADLRSLREQAAELLKSVGGSLRWVRRDVIVEKLGH